MDGKWPFGQTQWQGASHDCSCITPAAKRYVREIVGLVPISVVEYLTPPPIFAFARPRIGSGHQSRGGGPHEPVSRLALQKENQGAKGQGRARFGFIGDRVRLDGQSLAKAD